MNDEEDKPKIIVDDDWKTKAQEEKEQLQREAEAKAAAKEQAPVGDSGLEQTQASPPEASPAESQEAEMPLPPASFATLISSLATQTLAMLGQFPMPDGKSIRRLDHAKHYIDTLTVLEEKTKGNLEANEMVMLNNVLHDLRMAYVEASKHASAPATD